MLKMVSAPFSDVLARRGILQCCWLAGELLVQLVHGHLLRYFFSKVYKAFWSLEGLPKGLREPFKLPRHPILKGGRPSPSCAHGSGCLSSLLAFQLPKSSVIGADHLFISIYIYTDKSSVKAIGCLLSW